MNYSKKDIDRKIENITGQEIRQKNRFKMFLVTLFLAFLVYLLVVGIAVAAGCITEILKNTPSVSSVEQLRPSETKSIIYASDGSIMQELIKSGSNRETVSYDVLPRNLINAFVAIEDERFFDHEGVDIKGILRAVFTGLVSGNLSQGASTITQQLIKNNIFDGGYETNLGDRLERKLQEQYLAIMVEKELDKKTILQHYLNTINLGANTLGVQVASKRYFGKDVSDLDLQECTVLAAITKNPTRLNPITHPEENQKRRMLVLKDMLDQGYISDDEYDMASSTDVYARIQLVSENTLPGGHAFSYFTDTVFEEVVDALQTQLQYTDTQAYNALYSGGLRIYTTEDPRIQTILDEEINNESNYIITNADGSITNYYEYGMTYRLTIRTPDGNLYHYNEENVRNYFQDVLGDSVFKLTFDTEEAMHNAAAAFRNYILEDLKNAEVVSESLSSTIQPQASAIVIDQKTGHVLAVTGGRGNKDDVGSLTLNRAVDSTRQPGSCFKIICSYAPALDISGATLATTYYDSQLLIDNRSIANWWGSRYLGYANIHFAIESSMNIVAVKCMEQTVSENTAYTYAENLGITTLIPEDKTPLMTIGSLAYGVSNLELTSAYACIANNGIYNKPIFWTRVTDADGKIILENPQVQRTVLKDSTAKLLTAAMESVITPEFVLWPVEGVSATSADCHLDNMAAAGKSGTTNDANDIWFVGYTPSVTLGVWSGYDSSKSFGTSPGYHKRIWQKVMSRIHEGMDYRPFDYSGLQKARICSKSGLLAKDGICDATGDASCHIYDEYFAPGTAPTEYCNLHVSYSLCGVSGKFSTDFCPESEVYTKAFIQLKPEDNDGIDTVDTQFVYPAENLVPCNIHLAPEPSDDETEPTDTDPSESDPSETDTSEMDTEGTPEEADVTPEDTGESAEQDESSESSESVTEDTSEALPPESNEAEETP